MSKPIALVIGATGAQGGSVAAALSDKYQIRTLTRNPDKPQAAALREKGWEVMAGDLSDRETVRNALRGVEAAFLVTQFWESFDKEKEVEQGKLFADEVAAAGVRKFVFSALENVTKLTDGKITKVAHFDGKGQIMEYIKSKGIPAVFVMLSAYCENFNSFFVPRPADDGTFSLTLPDMGGKPFNLVSVAETGQFVKAILERYDEFVGKEVPLCSDDSTLEQVCEVLSRVTGKTVKYNPVPPQVFATFGFPGAEDLAAMFEFYAHETCKRPTGPAYELYPGASNFERWATANKESFSWAK